MWFVIHFKNHGATKIWANYMRKSFQNWEIKLLSSTTDKCNFQSIAICLSLELFFSCWGKWRPVSLAAGVDAFRPLTGLWTFLRRLLAADTVYCCVVTAKEQFQGRAWGPSARFSSFVPNWDRRWIPLSY